MWSFSLMNRIKTDSRNSLSQQQLSSILQICMEGPTSQEFDPKPAMQLWKDGVGAHRPNQSQRKKYTWKKPKKHGPMTLIDLYWSFPKRRRVIRWIICRSIRTYDLQTLYSSVILLLNESIHFTSSYLSFPFSPSSLIF